MRAPQPVFTLLGEVGGHPTSAPAQTSDFGPQRSELDAMSEGLVNEEARPYAQKIFNVLQPRSVDEHEVKTLGLDPGTTWKDYLDP